MASGLKAALATVVREVEECLRRIRRESAEEALLHIHRAPRIFLAGSGRSALGIRGFAMRLMHLGMDAHLVGETTTPPICAGDCLVIGSGSGRTPGLVAIAEKARAVGAAMVLFTIDPESSIAKLANTIVEIPAISPKAECAPKGQSVQPMGSLFEQCLFLLFDALILELMRKKNVAAAEMFKRHANLE